MYVRRMDDLIGKLHASMPNKELAQLVLDGYRALFSYLWGAIRVYSNSVGDHFCHRDGEYISLIECHELKIETKYIGYDADRMSEQ
jgi:hypothetical protein